jgi:hypothetical protein
LKERERRRRKRKMWAREAAPVEMVVRKEKKLCIPGTKG